MGTDIHVFIEYDFTRAEDYPAERHLQPFDDNVSVWDLRGDAISGYKDYEFFSALAGIRNTENGIKPLFPLRSFPTDCNWLVKRELDGACGISWLLADELVAALEHANLSHDNLSVPVQFLLETVAHLAKRCGDDRVRIVFGFD